MAPFTFCTYSSVYLLQSHANIRYFCAHEPAPARCWQPRRAPITRVSCEVSCARSVPHAAAASSRWHLGPTVAAAADKYNHFATE